LISTREILAWPEFPAKRNTIQKSAFNSQPLAPFFQGHKGSKSRQQPTFDNNTTNNFNMLIRTATSQENKLIGVVGRNCQHNTSQKSTFNNRPLTLFFKAIIISSAAIRSMFMSAT
jgi:hypothetical protein